MLLSRQYARSTVLLSRQQSVELDYHGLEKLGLESLRKVSELQGTRYRADPRVRGGAG